jgi:hypothetical protein
VLKAEEMTPMSGMSTTEGTPKIAEESEIERLSTTSGSQQQQKRQQQH